MLPILNNSLVAKVGLASATLSLVVALGIGTLSYYVTRNQLKEIQQSELQGSARVIATHLENEVTSLYGNLRGLASNTLFANGLADSGGRQLYLRPFLKGLQHIGNVPVSIVLHDFKGTPLESNDLNSHHDIETSVLRHVVDSGQPEGLIRELGTSDVLITLIHPVLYANTGLPEGSLSFQFLFSNLSMDVVSRVQHNDFRVIVTPVQGGDELVVSHGRIPEERSVFRRTEIPAQPILAQWKITVEAWEDGYRYAHGLNKLIRIYLLLGILGIVFIVPTSLIITRIIMNRLYSLEAVARKVVQTRSFVQRFPDAGKDEIASLGKAFNHMLTELNAAYLELRDEAHQKMKRQSERFRQVLSTTADGFIRIDMQTRLVVEVNDAFCRMTESSRAVLEGRQIPDFLKSIVVNPGKEEQRISWAEELDFTRKDDEITSFLIRCNLINEVDGASYLIAFLTDITDRRRAVNALRDSERRFRALWEFAPVAVVLVAVDGKVILLNSKAEQTFGYSSEEMIGQTVETFLPAGLHGKHRAHRRKYLDEQRNSRPMGTGRTFYAQHKNGKMFPVDVALDFSDAVEGGMVVAYVIDISEQKSVELALSNAKEEAEAANRSKSIFLANMSHELRTPLNAIMGYAQILRQGAGRDEKQIKGLDIIKNSGDHLLRLINDLLDLSKIESGRMELQETVFDLWALLSNINDIIEVKAREKRIDYIVEFDSDLPVGIRADEKKLLQILINILSNAVKFTDFGKIEFTVSSLVKTYGIKKQQNWDILRFKVNDTGPGIDSDKLEDIFEPFKQDVSSPHAIEGTGLGLTISRKIVQLMGSDLSVQSAPGYGSTFWFDLEVERFDDFRVDKIPLHMGRIVGYEGADRKILVVDDNSDNRGVLVNTLVPLGFDLEEAENGVDCYEKCKTNLPDVILLDLEMPVMGGIEAAEKIRGTDLKVQPIIIAVTASVYKNAQQSAANAGCNDFLPKPIDIDKLLDMLKIHLDIIWRYENSDDSDESVKDTLSRAEMARLEPADAETIRKLTQMGNARKILEELDSIVAKNTKYRPVSEEIRRYVKQYQFPKILELLEEYEQVACDAK